MLGGPDPFGINQNEPQNYPMYGGGYSDPAYGPYPGAIGYDDSPSWLDLISQGIGAAQDVARIAVGGYPPQDIYAPIYAPQYPAQPAQPLTPAQQAAAQTQRQSTGVGFQVSTPVLILGVGGLLLFLLGQKRGR